MKERAALAISVGGGPFAQGQRPSGNPIEIAAVVVWRVDDTAQAAFDVDDYEYYVPMQTESAVRHVASRTRTTSTTEDDGLARRLRRGQPT